jgi:phosphoglycolate phosphatase-like HAD superfamily hydrolase
MPSDRPSAASPGAHEPHRLRAPVCGALVALDSDGTVFPNMPAKFAVVRDVTIESWGLEPVRAAAEEVIRFVNLESRWRGSHRFPALLKMMEELAARPEPAASGYALPDLAPLARYVESGAPLSNTHLRAVFDRTGEPVLQCVLAWSAELSRRLTAATEMLAPMVGARRALDALRGRADAAVVSQAPGEQLMREWFGFGLNAHVFAIAGSECGRKAEQFRLLTAPGHREDRRLLIGDAPGDLDAAREAGAAFFPILPGREEASWARFLDGALDRVLAGTYRGEEEESMIREFLSALPEVPPWRR